MTTLVRHPQPPEELDLDQLRALVADREAALDACAADADRLQRELDMFAAQYRQQVGTLHDQLDQLELDIAEAELGELSKRVADAGARPSATAPPSPRSESAPRFTSDGVRKLFREVARAIHPDLAHDEHTRDRRHLLMIEANKAYALGDAEQLGRILEAWSRSPESVQGSDAAAMRLRLERRLAQINEQIDAYTSDLTAARASQLYELKTMVDDAAGKGRDLIAETVKRLKRDIMAATNRLEAMRSVP